MIKRMTAAQVWARGALYVAIAVLTELNPVFNQQEPINWPGVAVKVLLSSALVIRSFIDQSTTEATVSEPVPVKTAPGAPLETKEVQENPRVQSTAG